VLTRIQNAALAGNDGIALLPPPPGAVGTSIVVNSNNGVLVEIDNPQTANPTFHNIFTGGSRGDFATVGPDGCLYATQTASVIKVTASDGSCPFIPSICLPNPVIPRVHVTINGFTFNYNDTGQALNNLGIDGECNGSNESQAWQQIGGKGGPVNIPLPPAMTLGLQAAPSNGHIVGQSQAFTVATMDGAGQTVPNVAVQLGVFGANPQQLSGTTDVNGTATFSYIGSNAGTDTVNATAFISGLRTVSNAVPIQWTIPAPGGPIPGASGPAPPSVVITSPSDGSAVSQPVAITATVAAPPSSPINFWSAQYQNASGGSAVTLASGTTNPPATLATFDPTALAAGTYAITVTATTSAGGGATAVVRVIVGNGGGTTAQAPPTITAPSPADGTIVTKPVPVTATISPPSGQTIASWSVAYQAQDVEPIVTMTSGTGAPPSPLAIFDPTLLPNDTYAIVITATASGGGIQTLTTTVAVFGNLKLGRYVTTFQDLSVPVNGFQMEVRRTYDSIDKRVGDFGFGWHVDVANFRVSVNRQLGAGGWTEYPTSCIFGLCFYAFKTSAPHYVTVTFPDQHQEIFDFTPQGGAGILYWQGNAAFTPRAGTGNTSKLEVAGDSSLSYDFAGNLVGASGYFNPTRFKLTTHDGRVLILDTVLGLVSVTDRNGNALNIDGTGVHASNGQSIVYTRDTAGRITKITGPSGQALTYAYSAAGDLASSTDPNNNTPKYAYDANHYLLSVVGPAQTRPLSTLTYDANGRLLSVTDGNGNTAQISNNVPGQQETVTDATGKLTTVYTLDNLGDILRQDQIFDGKTLTSTATYDGAGRALSRTDPLNRTWTVSYNAAGDLLQLSTPQGNALSFTYDANGFPLTFGDPLGNITKYASDANGNLTTFTSALGQSDALAYDAQGHPITRTDPLNNTWIYTYDAAGRRTSMTDPLGNVTKYTYDASANLTSSTDPSGAVTTYTYDAAGHLTSSKDALGQVTSLAYDSLGRVASGTDAGGNKTSYAYDGTNALSTVTDPLGRVTTYTYDADGRLTTVTDPVGGVRTYAYDGAGRLTSEKDAVGRVTSYNYDNAGRLSSKTMPNGGVFTYAYNADGYQTSVTDPLGHTNSSVFDGDGRVTSGTDALGKTNTFTRDGLGRLSKTVDALGQVSSWAYDAAGRQASSTDALGQTTTYRYDAVGNRVGITDPLGHATSFAYDATGRLVKSTDALGRSISLAYDTVGRLVSTTLPSGNATTYSYDAMGHETKVTDPLGNTGSYGYDAVGQRISTVDPRGNSTTYGYDPAGRLIGITDALGARVTLTFDAGGQQTAITNPQGDTTRFTYDALGKLATLTDPAGAVTRFAYDVGGRLTSKTDPRGITVTSGYNANNRVTSTAFPGGAISQTYDAVGRRTAMTDPLGTSTFSYDAASNVTSVAAPQGAVGYAYDAAGRRTSMVLPGSRTVSYGYDAGNQLTSLTDWFGQTSTFTYSADGLPTGMSRPGGLQTSYTYDVADRMTSVNNDGPGGALKRFSYTLDANGNRASVTSGAGTESYVLDALNRVTSANYPNGDKSTYSYDAAGNRTSQTVNGATTSYTYDASHRLVQAGATTYSYDAAGNIVGAGADTFSWDWAGRLAQATVGGTASSYSYDADGTRVAAQVGTNSTSYLWDRQSSLPLLVDDGSHGYIHTSTGGVLEQLTSAGGSAALYPLPDALGSVRGLANASGALAGSADYNVFGAPRSTSGSSSVFGFTGQQTDATSLVFLRARYLDTGLGRFLAPDGVFPNAPGTQGYNLYDYVANNPMTRIDPSGHQGVIQLARTLLVVAAVVVLLSLAVNYRGTIASIRELINLIAAAPGAVADGVREVVDRLSKSKPDDQPKPGPSPSPIPFCIPNVPPCKIPSEKSQDDTLCPITGQPSPANRIAGIPVFCVYKHRTPEIYINDSTAQSRFPGHPPQPLHYEASAAAVEANRAAALAGVPLCGPVWDDVSRSSVKLSRDEYPFASSKEGGVNTGQKAQVRCVPRIENSTQGGDLGWFYDSELYRIDAAQFFVLPVPY
jgi:RHS repeat-associated protein